MTTCKAIYDLAAAGFIAPVGAEGEKLASPASEDLEEEITGSREKLTELKKAAADLVGAGRVEEVVVGGPEDELADIVVVEEATPGFPVSYTHLRAHETRHDLVCRLLLE